MAAKTPVTDINHGVGLYLLIWTIFTGLMLIVATRTSGVLIAVFGVLFLTFLALTIGKFSASVTDVGPNAWTKLGGYLGIITAILAWYGALAGLMNGTAKRVVFPTFPR